MTVFERLVRADGWRAIPRLTALALALVLVVEALVQFSGADHIVMVEVPYALWLMILPSAFVIMANRWLSVHRDLLREIGWSADEAARFLGLWERRIFAPSASKTLGSMALTAAGLVAIVRAPRMYTSELATFPLLFGFGVVLVTAGLFCFSITAYVLMIWRIALTPVPDARFRLLATSHPSFAQFESYWSWVAVFSASAYLAVLTATTSAPAPGMPYADVWLWAAAVAPATVVFLTLILLHHLRTAVRTRDELVAMQRLRQSWEAYRNRGLDEDLSRVATLITVFRATSADGGLPAIVRFSTPLAISLTPSILKILDSLDFWRG